MAASWASGLTIEEITALECGEIVHQVWDCLDAGGDPTLGCVPYRVTVTWLDRGDPRRPGAHAKTTGRQGDAGLKITKATRRVHREGDCPGFPITRPRVEVVAGGAA